MKTPWTRIGPAITGHSLLRSCGFLAPLALAALPAYGANLLAESRIEQVVLYPDAAVVTRRLTIEIPAGSHEIRLADLPLGADPASFRVEASGTGRLVLGGVDFRLGVADAKTEAELGARLKARRAARDSLLDRINATETRKAMVRRLAEGDPAPKDGKPLDLESWLKALEIVGRQAQALNDELRALRREEASIAEEIAALEAAIGPPEGREPRRVAAIAVEAAEAVKATLSLSYRVSDAAWQPVYDARLDTRGAKPVLEFTRRALIRQQTGEDWREAKLVLSTLQVERGTAAPVLTSEKLAFEEPRPRPRPVPLPNPMPMASAPAPETLARSAMQEDRAAKIPAIEPGATLATNPFHAEFMVPGTISLPSGEEERSVRLAGERIEPALQHKAAPLLDPTAYLEASFILKGEAPLLPGEVLLTRDGAFIGRAEIGPVAGGDKVQLGFGADDRVKIARVPVQKQAREPGLLGNNRSEESRFRTDIRNLHAFPINVQVLDRLPISEDQAIAIERLPEMTKPDLENVEDRRGIIGWNVTLAPQEAKSLVTAWRVRWPQGRRLRAEPLER